MRLRLAAGLLAALASGLAAGAAPASPVVPAPASATAATLALPSPAESAALAVSRSAGRLDAELATLDGGPLSLALERAARQGRVLRLLLDPLRPEARHQGLLLGALAPTVAVRWRSRAGSPLRWLVADGSVALAWDGTRGVLSAGDAALAALTPGRFERAWGEALTELPEGLRLDEQLRALPDPRVSDPHYKARRNDAAKDDGDLHADPAHTQP